MNHWTSLLSESYDDIRQLKSFLGLSEEETQALEAVQKKYPMLVNPYYLSLIDPDDPNDPIRRMCIPSVNEESAEGSMWSQLKSAREKGLDVILCMVLVEFATVATL